LSHFLALSFSPGFAAGAEATRLRDRARHFLGRLGEAGTLRELPLPPGEELLYGGDASRLHHDEDSGALGLVLVRQAYEVGTGRIVAPSELAGLGPDAVDELCRGVAPPFGALSRASNGQPLVAATDSCGLQHLYAFQGAEWAAVASSSVVLAALAGTELDATALGRYALIGHFVGSDSSFRGVRKLDAASRWHLQDGRIAEAPYRRDAAPAERFPSREQAAQAGTEVVEGCLRACLAEHPDAVLELSGGVDSRLVLAALPADLRSGREAVTLGVADSGDVRVARRLAADFGLVHRWVDIGGLSGLDREQVMTLAKSSAQRRDYSANPFAVAVLEWVQAQLDDRPRLTGQNGEVARGFYYPGQPAAPETTQALVEALARWRLLVNDAVDVELLDPGFAADCRAEALRTTQGIFAEYGGAWLDATDRFYLEQRMQHWVGVGYSSVAPRRVVLSPFFHPAFLSWAWRVPPQHKRGSAVFCEMVSQLDPQLARIPLDSGLSPRDMFSGGLGARLRTRADFLRRAVRKVRQRLLGAAKVGVGAEALSHRAAEGSAGEPLPLERVRELPFLDGEVVEAVATGRRRVKSSSLGLLLNLEWILEFSEG
jgi:asparagine synthase (glutamine-hydrolysing)